MQEATEMQPFAGLTFAKEKADTTWDLWNVAESGDYGKDNAIGAQYAEELVDCMQQREVPFMLGHVIEAMISKKRYGGIEIGFTQRISEKSLGLEHARALPTTQPASAHLASTHPHIIERPKAAAARRMISVGAPTPVQTQEAFQERKNRTDTTSTGDHFVRLPYIVEKLGISRQTIYRMIANGEFPKQVKQGRISSWANSEVEAYINRVKATR
ncbi:AlpA family phage regulatory protein [Rhizobium rhizogenes]|uniref:helix-turn-helix transcriptional regulator n=1 Tax=Rhizobium rhizogenes TaxID=359 RepID=UPI003ECCAB2C